MFFTDILLFLLPLYFNKRCKILVGLDFNSKKETETVSVCLNEIKQKHTFANKISRSVVKIYESWFTYRIKHKETVVILRRYKSKSRTRERECKRDLDDESTPFFP